MKYTIKNLKKEVPKLKLDNDLQRRWDLIQKVWQAEKLEDRKGKSTAEMVNFFVMQLNERYGDNPSQKPPKSPKPKKEKKEKQPKPAKTDTAQQVEKILPEVGFIRRFATLDGKMIKTSRDSALRILNALQKAIVEKVIRKTSPYADEIMKIQENLIKVIDSNDGNAVIEVAEKYKEIAKSQRVCDNVALIKKFLSIQGKEGVTEKAQSLLQKVMAVQEQSNLIVEMKMSLMNYLDEKTPIIEINSQTLQGLYGLAGIEFETPKSGTSVQSTQFLGATFDTLPFTGKWANFIGKPNRNFKIMIYGKAGGGKSTLSLKLAHYLASNIGLRVLYVAGEEKLGSTLHEKTVRLGIASPNLYFNDMLPKDLSKFDVVFIDSVNTLGLEPSDLERLPNNKAYVYIFQCTKDGKYRGSQEFEHNVDTVIEVENTVSERSRTMTAKMHKNRFGGKEKEFKI